jgi:hypothetical protein
MPHPKKIETVHIETLDNELCIYDWQRMEVHNLNPTAARVWELCDGQTTPQQMAAQLHGDLTPAQAEELVWLTLKRLEQAHLLDERDKVAQPAGRKVLTRRELLTQLGVAAVMLPVITSIVAPSPAAAQSHVGGAIVRTVNVGTTDGLFGYQFFTFNEGPITDAQIAACNPTSITYAWTGAAVPAGNGGIRLVQSNGVGATTMIVNAGTASPLGPLLAVSSVWTGNRPYNGVDIDAFATDWNVGVLTITLA